MLLALLESKPSYGYELIKRIEEQFGGAYAPSPGSVYPTLTLMDETGLVRGQPDEQGKRRYELSSDGRAYLEANRVTVDAVRTRMELAARALAGERPPEAIFQALQTLKAALAFHRAGWSDAEVQRVSGLIHEAAQAVQATPTPTPTRTASE